MKPAFDVAIIGAGVAGTAAALAAAASGAQVCVIAASPGTTALFSGAWYGAAPGGLLAALQAAGYPLQACDRPLPHPRGNAHSATLAAAPHARDAGDEALVCGIAGLPGFDAAHLARAWSASLGRTLRPHVLHLAETPAAGWSPAALAVWLARDIARIADPLRAAVTQNGAQGVILPAVLGRAHDDAVHRAIEAAAGCRVQESLAVPPSLPGWRLNAALGACLENAGVARFAARVVGRSLDASRVTAVQLDSGDVISASRFVLATGKYAGGGISANGEFRETALDCPVWLDHLGEVFESVDPLNLTDVVRTEDQPLLLAGVHVDQEQRPVNRTQDVVFENVFVAGSVRAGVEAAVLPMGDAAEDGWNAGTRAVRA